MFTGQYSGKGRQSGQSMVEYVIVLAFGVMVLTTGPGGDVLLELANVIRSNYQGYSYTVSLPTMPDQDTLNAYLNDADIPNPINPNDLVTALQNYTDFPALDAFPADLLPNSPADIIDGVGSFF